LGFPIDNYWPFLTSMLLHAGLIHLAGNMWTLWIFGDNVEDRMGRWRFLAFYVLCGIISGQVHWWTNPHSTVPVIGASGAIAGVLGAYAVLYPHARVQTLVLLLFWPLFFELPAVIFIAVWFGIQFLSGTAALLGPGQLGGIAWWAHIGGFIAGIALHRLFIVGDRHSRSRSKTHY
jgi:membrane associated rhomboid family serine protease